MDYAESRPDLRRVVSGRVMSCDGRGVWITIHSVFPTVRDLIPPSRFDSFAENSNFNRSLPPYSSFSLLNFIDIRTQERTSPGDFTTFIFQLDICRSDNFC